MREEIRHIADDHAALRWSLGCLSASYRERMKIMKLLDLAVVRWGIALWAALQAVSGVFDAVFVLSYKLRVLRLTELLGGRTEGDSYSRFMPLMNDTPAWESVVSLLASALYVAGMVQILRRRRSAAGLFIAAVLLSAGLWIHDLTRPLFAQAFTAEHLRRDALLYLITALLAVLLWEGNRSPPQRAGR